MSFSDFSSTQQILLASSVFFIACSIILYLRKKYTVAIAALFAGALLLHFFAGLLDPFLNLWDERFHALVAKNMVSHPFSPMLYSDPVVQTDYNGWDRAYIWLHKQPEFLWQIALSFKIFGYSELALRIPSIFMSSILVLLAYRIGKILVSEQTGYYAAFLTTTSFFIIQLVSGIEGMDHNDLAFTFYVSASIWAWLEFSISGKMVWVILIGIFSGCAILNKWLTGFIVYAAWLITMLTKENRRFVRKEIVKLVISVAIACIVFIPWQLYILYTFPAEARTAYDSFSQHIYQSLEGHIGNGWFHVEKLSAMYGEFAPYLLLPGFILLYFRIKRKELKWSIVLIPFIAYAFFAYVKTKVPSHVFFVCLPVYLALAVLPAELVEWAKKIITPKLVAWMEFVFLLFIGYVNLNFAEVHFSHAKEGNGQHYEMLTGNKAYFLSLRNSLPDSTVLFNIKGRHYIEAMFYSGFTAYRFIPSQEQVEELKEKRRHIAVVDNHQLPEYLLRDTTVIILRREIRGYE